MRHPSGAVPRARAGRGVHPAVPRLAVLTAGAAACAYLYGTDPHRPGQWLPPCPFHRLTGLLCPACGATRMVYDLMHGHLAAAWHDNALALLAAPAAAALLLRWLADGPRGVRRPPPLGRRGALALAGTAVAWAVLRNTV